MEGGGMSVGVVMKILYLLTVNLYSILPTGNSQRRAR
jgi:hypothetical protein